MNKNFFSITIASCGYVGESNNKLLASCGKFTRFLWAFSVNFPQLVNNFVYCCAHIRPHIHKTRLRKILRTVRAAGRFPRVFTPSLTMSSFFVHTYKKLSLVVNTLTYSQRLNTAEGGFLYVCHNPGDARIFIN